MYRIIDALNESSYPTPTNTRIGVKQPDDDDDEASLLVPIAFVLTNFIWSLKWPFIKLSLLEGLFLYFFLFEMLFNLLFNFLNSVAGYFLKIKAYFSKTCVIRGSPISCTFAFVQTLEAAENRKSPFYKTEISVSFGNEAKLVCSRLGSSHWGIFFMRFSFSFFYLQVEHSFRHTMNWCSKPFSHLRFGSSLMHHCHKKKISMLKKKSDTMSCNCFNFSTSESCIDVDSL